MKVRSALLSPLLIAGHLQVPELLSDAVPDGLDQVLSGRVRNQLRHLHEPLNDQGVETDPVEPVIKMLESCYNNYQSILPDRHDGEADDDVGDVFLPVVLTVQPADELDVVLGDLLPQQEQNPSDVLGQPLARTGEDGP